MLKNAILFTANKCVDALPRPEFKKQEVCPHLSHSATPLLSA